MPTPTEIMEMERKRALEQAEQVEKDMRDLERIVSKYKLLVVAPVETYTPPTKEGLPRSIFTRAQEEGEEVIRTAGHPLPIGELFQMLLDRGLEFGGRNPVSTLSACLIKNPHLKYIPRIGWWLRHVSWPPKPEEVAYMHGPPPEAIAETGTRRRRRTQEKERLYQELRKFLEGKTEPVPFRDIFNYIKEIGIPIGGSDERQNLSAFMTSIHEFRTHGAEGRGGWTFTPDITWNVVRGFGGTGTKLPRYRRTPAKQRLFEAVRSILKDRTERLLGTELFDQVKKMGVSIGGAGVDERQYFRGYMSSVPCFKGRKDGWLYVPELDEEAKLQQSLLPTQN
jgi:hypothetical protein